MRAWLSAVWRDAECRMKATNFRLEAPGSLGGWAGKSRSPKVPVARKPIATEPGTAPRLGLLERLDRWLWRQHVREREAFLADSKDVYELEERMRRLERTVGSRYY